MLRDLIPLLFALAVAAVVYALREMQRRRRRINPPQPDVTMQEVWDSWLEGMPSGPDRALLPAGQELLPASPEARDTIERGLLETEKLCLEGDNPRVALRQAILESTTIALYLEAISECDDSGRRAVLKGFEEGMEGFLRDGMAVGNLRWLVLRHYLRLKFDDATVDDWFHHYLRVARPYIREKVRLARDSVLQMDESAGRFAKIYDSLLQELLKEHLEARPKKRFPPADLT